MNNLNGVLNRENGLRTQPCQNFTGAMLRDVQRALFDARTPELDRVYQGAKDTRRMVHLASDDLEGEHAKHASLEQQRPDLVRKLHDGLCHETVMWYVHHLSESARE